MTPELLIVERAAFADWAARRLSAEIRQVLAAQDDPASNYRIWIADTAAAARLEDRR